MVPRPFLAAISYPCAARQQEMVCMPGEEVFCSCGAGTMGTKTCLPDGSAFGACGCP